MLTIPPALLYHLPPLHVFGLPYPDNPWLVGLHNLSDFVIGVSYVAISATLAWLVRRARRAIPFSWMFLAFGAFILGCGVTHFMHVLTVWRPQYWILLAVAQAVTVLASFVTAALLPPLVPKGLALLESARLSEQRKGELERANAALQVQIVERAHAGAALAASEARFRSAFEHAAIGKALVGLDGRWLRVNCALCGLLGYREEELLATTFQLLTHPDDLDADLDLVRRLLAGAIVDYELEKRYLHRDGHAVWGLLSVSLVRDAAGAPLHFIAEIQDIGARKRAEAGLVTSHRALEAKTREQEAFVYTVAHDLRAPLLSMQGMAGILLEDYAPRLDDGRLYVERVVANAGKMQALLDELLALSRVGRVDVEPEAIAPDAVVADVCAQLHHTLTARGARVDVAGPLPTVRANRVRMVQLFANLIANAVHYTPPERAPLVRIATAPHPDGWEVTVADNGVGIPAAYRDTVFGLFQRLPGGKALNPGGTGAGLAIVARIVDTHGGTLWFDSIEEAGTTFHFTLPAAPRPDRTTRGDTGMSGDATAAGLRVYLIDDDPDHILLIGRAIRETGPTTEVRTCQDGEAALAELRALAAPPDLILLDINMGGLDGFAVLAAVKGDARLRAIPVVMLTSSGLSADVARAYELGASGYISKPSYLQDLRAVLGNTLLYWSAMRRATAVEGGAS